MASIWHKLEKHLPFVNSPSQYIGGEWNAILKLQLLLPQKPPLKQQSVHKVRRQYGRKSGTSS